MAPDRKAAIRDYKETPRPIGVFQVRNTINGKALVGTSTDLPAMLNSQKWRLVMGIHPNKQLQGDWNDFGEAAFAFEIVDTLAPLDGPACDPSDDLRALEAMWLEKISPYDDRGYHSRPRRGS